MVVTWLSRGGYMASVVAVRLCSKKVVNVATEVDRRQIMREHCFTYTYYKS